MNKAKNIQKPTKNAWSIDVVIMRFFLVVTLPIVNILWILLIIVEFISKLIYNAKLSKKWKFTIERLFKNAL